RAGPGPRSATDAPASVVEAERERLLEVDVRVRAEGDERLRAQDALHLADAVGDDVRELVVLLDAHHRDEVRLARDRVDLADALEVGDLGRDLGDARGVGVDQDDGGEHGSSGDGSSTGDHSTVTAPPGCRSARVPGPSPRSFRYAPWPSSSGAVDAPCRATSRAVVARSTCDAAERTGHAHGPAASTIRTPGCSSHDRRISASCGWPAGPGGTGGATVSAVATSPCTSGHGSPPGSLTPVAASRAWRTTTPSHPPASVGRAATSSGHAASGARRWARAAPVRNARSRCVSSPACS